jgi:hypothetical protein
MLQYTKSCNHADSKSCHYRSGASPQLLFFSHPNVLAADCAIFTLRCSQMASSRKECTHMTEVKQNQGSDGTFMVLDARVVKATATDLILDASNRRKPGGGPFRRALVHNQNDGLTINFAGDYPGGVTVDSAIRLAEIIPPRGPGLGSVPTLLVRGHINYQVQGLKADGSGSTLITQSLTGELGELQSQVTELQAKVAALEAKVG